MQDIRKTRLEWGSEIGPFEIQNYPDFRSQKVMLQGLDHLKNQSFVQMASEYQTKNVDKFFEMFLDTS